MKGRRCSRGLLLPSRRLPWKATPGKALGCEGYVPTRAAFGKGCGYVFFDFMTGHGRGFRRICHTLARSSTNGQLAATKPRRNAILGRNAMDRILDHAL